jgi:hypothetical protein
MRFAFVKAVLCVAVGLSFAHAQQPAVAVTALSTSTDSRATVYVYRYKQFVGSALSPSVYCDENELARMDNGKFFVVKLPPGTHIFRSNDRQAGITVDLKGGQEYYIRVELAAGFMKGHGRLLWVGPEQGTYEIKNLKPLSADKVKDPQRVVPAGTEEN